jgi:SAM-dependent methyltransferase
VPREVFDRREGRSVFGRDPAGYDRGRPGHPDRVYEVLRQRCGLRDGTRVLEIGPGTGQATRRLIELGAEPLVAVEPDPALAQYLPSVTDGKPDIVSAPLEEAELPAAFFDLAVAASSFHWVDSERGLIAVLQALRPGGWWAMWWTYFGDKTRADPFRDAIDHVVGGLPSSPGAEGFGRDADAAMGALTAAGFESYEHELVRWSREWDAADIRALFATFSPIARLEETQRNTILDEVARIAEDDFGGNVVKPAVTSLYTARRPEQPRSAVH